MIPSSVADAAALLKQVDIPVPIIDVVQTLQTLGHDAVLVGGAVRDALLGLPAEDWDIASSATPKEVQKAFRRTIPTGIEHGTVTVMVPCDGAFLPIEVTTFRGEGLYRDGRRPESVRFLRDLVEDLARRDFTVNAFAWDPVQSVFSDPFDGLSDLSHRWVRAVGDPAQRFAEDGLRTMRAVRFCATRELKLEPTTQAAIPGALEILDRVSRERVLVELTKLLSAQRPSAGLRPMLETGMWSHILAPVERPELERAIDAVDRLPADAIIRLARLMRPLAERQHAAVALERFDALKPSKAERQRLERLLSPAAQRLAVATTDLERRRMAAELGREYIFAAMQVYELEAKAQDDVTRALEGAPLRVRDLAIGGRDLLAANIVSKGPQMGDVLEHLFQWVLEDPSRNQAKQLLEAAPWFVQLVCQGKV